MATDDLVSFPPVLESTRAARILNWCRSARRVAVNGGAMSTDRAGTGQGGGKIETE